MAKKKKKGNNNNQNPGMPNSKNTPEQSKTEISISKSNPQKIDKPERINIKQIPTVESPAVTTDDKLITSKEFSEFERLRKSRDDKGDFNFDVYQKLIEMEMDKEVAAEKKKAQVEIEKLKADEKKKMIEDTKDAKENLSVQLEKQKSDWEDETGAIKSELDNLKKQKIGLEKEIKDLEVKQKALLSRVENIESEIEKKIESANAKSDEIIEKGKADAKKILKKREDELNQREDALDKLEQKLKDEEDDIDRTTRRMEEYKARLGKKEEIYNTAKPDEIKKLNMLVEAKQDHIDKLTEGYSSLQKRLDNENLSKLKLGSKSPEDIIEENEQLQKMIDELKDKLNRFTAKELDEMREALDNKPSYESEIERLRMSIRESKTEMLRLQNADRELDNIKSRVELINALNEHLKHELQTSKEILESTSGDSCPMLTVVDCDERKPEANEKYKERKSLVVNSKDVTLPVIINHVKTFAASQEVSLYYKEADLRAFVAGLASSKIAILQGLSGTGKTSLPNIFADALFTESKLVSVEASWRDRNELLGYYNAFEKKFTAKDFTRYLYQAGLDNYSDTPYFIILDEMNLSRVEYYFTDFLSVLEISNPNDRKVSLADVDLRGLPIGTNKEVSNDLAGWQNKLLNGNTLIIPQNVWFIGTANRDESTFEITDKVYDRANVLNFVKAVPEPIKSKNSDRLYIPYSALIALFIKAKKTYKFEYDKNKIIEDVDRFLEEEFKVSFGNRIGNQMNDFVRVYIACGEGVDSEENLRVEAIDYQIANKVLRKLDNKDTTDKTKFETLKEIFRKHNLRKCESIIGQKIESEG